MTWQAFTLLVLVLAAGVIVWLAYRLSRCAFRCKACGGTFRIGWRRALFVEHIDRDYRLTCPHCGKKGWCALQPAGGKRGKP